MEVLDLTTNAPVLFLPIYCLADEVIGKQKGAGININVRKNRFFRYLDIEMLDDEIYALCKNISSERSGREPGVILVTRDNHLAVVADLFEDISGYEYYLPVLWNAQLTVSKPPIDYYNVYCKNRRGDLVGQAFVSYAPQLNVDWNETDASKFTW